ncbi:hypothetical protein Tco_0866890 [Tanacetum coccineum]
MNHVMYDISARCYRGGSVSKPIPGPAPLVVKRVCKAYKRTDVLGDVRELHHRRDLLLEIWSCDVVVLDLGYEGSKGSLSDCGCRRLSGLRHEMDNEIGQLHQLSTPYGSLKKLNAQKSVLHILEAVALKTSYFNWFTSYTIVDQDAPYHQIAHMGNDTVLPVFQIPGSSFCQFFISVVIIQLCLPNHLVLLNTISKWGTKEHPLENIICALTDQFQHGTPIHGKQALFCYYDALSNISSNPRTTKKALTQGMFGIEAHAEWIVPWGLEKSYLDEDKESECVDPSHYRGSAYEKAPDAVKKDLSMRDHAGCQDKRRCTFWQYTLLGDRLCMLRNGVIELYFVNTEYQLADIFTKALGRERIEFLINKLGMRSFTPDTLKQLADEVDE